MKTSKKTLKTEIGNYLVEQILESVSVSKSPVSGKGWKSSLSPEYAQYKKGISGVNAANMELFGDMLDALEYKHRPDGIEIGIFNRKQAQKADNHCKFSGASIKTKVPQRTFIPNEDKDERFRPDIMREIKKIIKEFE